MQNKVRQEQRIKNRLHMLEQEEQTQNNFDFKRLSKYSPRMIYGKNSFHDLSDWSNTNHQLENPYLERQMEISKRLNELMSNSTQMIETKFKLAYQNSPRYQSSLLNNQKKKRISLSPIVVKFNAKVLNQNLLKSRYNFLRKMKDEPFARRFSLNQLFQMKSKKSIEKKMADLELDVDFFQSHEKSLPKTERMSGILRLMKKHEPVRLKKRRINPQDLTAYKIK